MVAPDNQTIQAEPAAAAQTPAEESLKRALLRAEHAEIASGGFVYEWDIQSGLVERTHGLLRLTGYQPAELAPSREAWTQLIHPDDRPATPGLLAERAGTYSLEYRVRHRDGHYLHVWDRGLVLHDEQGRPLRVVGSTIDITERKRAAAASALLAEVSSALSDAALDEAAIPDRLADLMLPGFGDWFAVLVAGADGALRLAAERGAERASALLACADVLDAAGGRHTALMPAPDADGATLLVAPVTIGERSLGALLWSCCGQHRHFDQTDADLATEIARRVALALESARLYRQAQEAVAERDMLFMVATHDLRNALTGLLGQAQLLHRRAEADGLSERNRRSVQTIFEQSTRLNRMITSLMDLARMREGRLTIDTSEVDVAALVERIVSSLQPALSQHELVLTRPDGPLVVIGDAVRLEQVVQNLLSNAVKYSPAGGQVLVEVTAEAQHALITVADHGIGIPASALPRLFERFFRAANAAGQANASMGVGLYVVNEIVTRHGGTVIVESAESRGSRFSVRLPLRGQP